MSQTTQIKNQENENFFADSYFHWTKCRDEWCLKTTDTRVRPSQGEGVLVTTRAGKQSIQKIGDLIARDTKRQIYTNLGRVKDTKPKLKRLYGSSDRALDQFEDTLVERQYQEHLEAEHERSRKEKAKQVKAEQKKPIIKTRVF